MRREVEQFMKRTGIAPSTFGRAACGDPQLVADIRKGRILRPKTAERLRVFMESYK